MNISCESGQFGILVAGLKLWLSGMICPGLSLSGYMRVKWDLIFSVDESSVSDWTKVLVTH
jgi:hypothetical protein